MAWSCSRDASTARRQPLHLGSSCRPAAAAGGSTGSRLALHDEGRPHRDPRRDADALRQLRRYAPLTRPPRSRSRRGRPAPPPRRLLVLALRAQLQRACPGRRPGAGCPRMDLPSMVRAVAAERDPARKRLAAWTKRAAARACRPSRLRMRDLARGSRGLLLQDLAGHVDGALALVAHHPRHLQQVALAQPGQLDEHGQVHAGHDLHRGERKGRLTLVGVPPNMSVRMSTSPPPTSARARSMRLARRGHVVAPSRWRRRRWRGSPPRWCARR